MASNSEIGNAKNLGNYKFLIETVKSLEPAYNPSNNDLVSGTMSTFYSLCEGAQKALNKQIGIFEPIRNNRIIVFAPVKPLVRRVHYAAKTCGSSSQFVDDVYTLVKKILGERMSKPKPTATDPAGTSGSQLSFDNAVDFMDKLIQILNNEPKYKPSKDEIKVAGLTQRYEAMDKSNKEVKQGEPILTNARILRDNLFYRNPINLVENGQMSKDEVRNTFGFSSPEFKKVSKIKFKRLIEK